MKPAAGKLFLFALLILSLAPPLAQAQKEDYALLAHGNSQALWVAEVIPHNDPLAAGVRTVFRYRTHGDGANWRPLTEVAARVTQLSDRGGELIILLESNDWMIVSDSGVRSGVSLPGRGKIFAIAGNANNVWAIGEDRRPPPASEPTTTPATTTVSAPATPAPVRIMTTSPADAPAELGLFSLERGGWVYKSDLPEDVRSQDIRSLTLLDRRPLAAIAGDDQKLRLYQYADDWSDPIQITPLAPSAKVNLLNLDGRPIVAVSDAADTWIYVGGEKWSDAIKLQPPPEAAGYKHRAIAAGLGQIKLLCSNGPGKLIEQAYQLDGKLAGTATQSTQQTTFSMDRMWFALQIVAMVVLLIVMVGTLRRRSAIQQASRQLDQLNIAPLGARFAAGIIDAIPLFVAFVLTSPSTATPNQLTMPQLGWLAGGVVVYILHTTVSEMIAGRTIGKMLFGLRVVALDGTRASAWAVLTRNVLRIIDVMLMFPLTLMIFLPLRQRLGDLAAGTLVVRDPVESDDEESEA